MDRLVSHIPFTKRLTALSEQKALAICRSSNLTAKEDLSEKGVYHKFFIAILSPENLYVPIIFQVFLHEIPSFLRD